MSTSFVIARPDPADPEKWRGVYGHAGGEPTHAGKHLFGQVQRHFQGDVGAALAYYVDQHPGGWAAVAEALGGSECFCHDIEPGLAPDMPQTERGAGGMDWTYVLRPDGLEIRTWGQGVVTKVPWDADRVDWDAVQKGAYRR